jgi:hypothetical protein
LKFSAFSGYFTSKYRHFLKVWHRYAKHFESWMFSSWLCVDLVMQNTFKVECWQKRHVVIFQWMFCTFKVFCMLKSAQNIRCGHFFGSGRLRTWFQSVFARTHGKIWADADPLKVKYLVNAVYFIRKLRGNGLIF